MDALDPDMRVEKKENEIHTNLGYNYLQEIIKFQASYEVQYKEDYNY